MTNGPDEPVVVEVTVSAPIAAVWTSLREPELIKLWHGWECDQLDEEVAQIYLNGVVSDDENHVLSIDGGDRFELIERGDETLVRIVRPTCSPDEEGSEFYDDITQGWISFLQQLRFMHEMHPGRQRRTLFFSDRGDPSAVATLMLETPRQLGQRWFSTDQQNGMMLPDLGPGLLITAVKDAVIGEEGASVADSMAIITVYGLDEGSFRRHEDEWTDWWRSGFPTPSDTAG